MLPICLSFDVCVTRYLQVSSVLPSCLPLFYAGSICHKLSVSLPVFPVLFVCRLCRLVCLFALLPLVCLTVWLTAILCSVEWVILRTMETVCKATLERTLPPDVQEDAIHNKACTVCLSATALYMDVSLRNKGDKKRGVQGDGGRYIERERGRECEWQ